jgi:Flp pilus assembly secretin CpaC
VIEKILPMMYAILDEDAGAKVFDVWQANSQTNILQAPRLVVPNGSTGYCSDCAHTPFVVGRKDGQPQIRIVDDGTTLQLRPLVYGQDKLKLVFRAEFSSILSVETTNLSTVSNNGKPDTVQIPEVETLRVEGSVDLPWKNWMLLRGLERKNGAHGPEMIVMLRAEKIKESDLGKAAAGK